MSQTGPSEWLINIKQVIIFNVFPALFHPPHKIQRVGGMRPWPLKFVPPQRGLAVLGVCVGGGGGVDTSGVRVGATAHLPTRPPTRRPQGAPLCLCATHTLSLCNTKTAYVGSKMTQKSKMPPNGSPCHHFDLSGHGNGSHGPPGAIGTTPGPQNGQTFFLFADFPPWAPLGHRCGAALKGRLHWFPLIPTPLLIRPAGYRPMAQQVTCTWNEWQQVYEPV